MPEPIVVGVLSRDRTRDMTPTHTLERPEGTDDTLATSGGADVFLRFLVEELIPTIDRAYRTQPYRILVGHSFGGLFALHAWQRTPDLFQAYVALDPSVFWDEEVLHRRANASGVGPSSETGRQQPIYIGRSGAYGDGYRGESIDRFMKDLGAREDVSTTVRDFQDESHQSLPLVGLYDGLRSIFEDYRITPGLMFQHAHDLSAVFLTHSTRLGMDARPPEGFVDDVGQAFLKAGEVERAIGLFTYNVALEPGSARAHKSLGMAYAAAGQTQLAIQSYDRSLRIRQDDEVSRGLQRLRGR
jgi:hypothetical protein